MTLRMSNAEARAMAADLLFSRSVWLSTWESAFLVSLLSWVDKRPFTIKQITALEHTEKNSAKRRRPAVCCCIDERRGNNGQEKT